MQRLVDFLQGLSPGGDEGWGGGRLALSLCDGRLVSLPGDLVAGAVGDGQRVALDKQQVVLRSCPKENRLLSWPLFLL